MPFIGAIKAGVRSIMVGHLSIPAIDSKPASLSKRIITDLLRENLGFNGLILTDALNMKALKGFEHVSTECIKAGADILLHPLDADVTVEELTVSVEGMMISEEDINVAVSRILKTKVRILNTEGREVDYKRHEILSSQITDKSVTLFKNTTGLLITDESNVRVILAGENTFFESSYLKSIFKNVSTVTHTKEVKNKTVLFAIFTSIAAWKGTSGIDDVERKRISQLIKMAKTSIVISFGCPYVLRYFEEADVLIAAYEATEQAQKAVVKCLTGEMDFKGQLPVRLNFPE
jgi:beta-glucosidase-like glycosyl hydrolase